jgi:hypothetical protein
MKKVENRGGSLPLLYMDDIGSNGNMNRNRYIQPDSGRQNTFVHQGQLPVDDGLTDGFAQTCFIALHGFNGFA